MTTLTREGGRLVSDVAARYGVSEDAVETLLAALSSGQGRQAQFSHPELGGMGQWSGGGMVMVGDMFNNALKAKVDAICTDLARALADGLVVAAPAGPLSGAKVTHTAWPADLGTPSSTGVQNAMRYAVFPQSRRLAIETDGNIEVFATGDHHITGVSQQQGSDRSLSFVSQHGVVTIAQLDRVTTGPAFRSEPRQDDEPLPEPTPRPPEPPTGATPGTLTPPSADIVTLIEKLAALKDSGVLTEAEFAAKKAELLARL